MYRKILLFILSIACGSGASAQTWQKALEGAQKALSRPRAATMASSRAALLNARMNMAVPSHAGIQAWVNGKLSPVIPALSDRLQAWAVLSNRLMLKDQPLREAQLRFFASYQEVPAGLLSFFAGLPLKLPARIAEKTRYVLVGAKAGDAPSQEAFKKAVLQYRKAFPKRKIIILAAALPGRGIQYAREQTVPEPYQAFVRAFSKEGFPVAGIGETDPKPKGYLQQEKTHLIVAASEAPAGQAAHNFHLRQNLLLWQKAFPQAVFFVVVPPQAAAYDWRYSLANALPNEETFSLSITSVPAAGQFLFHRWSQFKKAKPGVLLWNHPTWARMSGFDAQIITQPL